MIRSFFGLIFAILAAKENLPSTSASPRLAFPLRITVHDLSGRAGCSIFAGGFWLTVTFLVIVYYLLGNGELTAAFIILAVNGGFGAAIIAYGKWLNRPRAEYAVSRDMVVRLNPRDMNHAIWTEPPLQLFRSRNARLYQLGRSENRDLDKHGPVETVERIPNRARA